MQTATTARNLQRTDMRIGIVILALLGLLAVGAFVTIDRADAPAAIVDPMPNTLPDAVVRPMSFEQIRFLEMNMLPGDGAPLVAPASDRPGERY